MRRLYLVIYIIFCGTSIFAIEKDSLYYSLSDVFIIDSIKVNGNEITEEYIITRELNFKEGDTLTGNMLFFNRERVYSLGLFNKVRFRPVKKGKTTINIDVEESWYIYPLPVVNLENSSFDRASYGFNLLLKNFRGRNETINAYVTFGYDPTVSLHYYVPVIYEGSNLSLSNRLVYVKSSNKSPLAEKLLNEEFDNRIIYYEVIFGKRINIYNTIYFTGTYKYVEALTDRSIKSTLGINNIVKYPSFGMIYEFDTRDLKQFPKEGYFITGGWQYHGFSSSGIDYHSLKADYREYRKLTPYILTKWRLLGRHTFGSSIPYFDNSFIGYDEIVRGHQDDVREGNNYIMASFELKYPVIEEWDFSIKLPLLPRKLTSARIAIYLEGFGDTGLTFNNDEKIGFNKLYSGYGAGVTVLFLPYNALRIAYAFNEYREGEIIIGTGFSF